MDGHLVEHWLDGPGRASAAGVPHIDQCALAPVEPLDQSGRFLLGTLGRALVLGVSRPALSIAPSTVGPSYGRSNEADELAARIAQVNLELARNLGMPEDVATASAALTPDYTAASRLNGVELQDDEEAVDALRDPD